ncbi:hypothetical protein LSH36_40g19045 [Paralvinella palmiformis]|uniref:Uncharacterized protein n=1 Tax=Paralvinella palmiformis TaxID=53620 RepID=A0AAD9NGI8_9ANNE|nr:hypothetical protein LSH36_40g19045 [Paralvinella palmiformis]
MFKFRPVLWERGWDIWWLHLPIRKSWPDLFAEAKIVKDQKIVIFISDKLTIELVDNDAFTMEGMGKRHQSIITCIRESLFQFYRQIQLFRMRFLRCVKLYIYIYIYIYI